ncbi:radical SAM protein [Inediibacterium massiliense]|uniref:radical SAM protein n=1 Tax=Inediibacterium massiliense TaxID=1658111 RepID=UPI0006B4864C|nr:radical SAM protein [Inediibacterium massiliense]
MIKQSITPNIDGLNFSLNDIETAKKENKPMLLTLYTRGICNVKCPSCFIEASDEKFNELTIKQYYNILKEAKDLGIKSIKISGAGEPLMDDRILDIAQYIKELGMKCIIYTNGTFLGDDNLSYKIHHMSSLELIEKLFSLDVSIVLKFNSFKAEVQDYFVGVKGSGKKIKKGLDNLLYIHYNDTKNNAHKLAIQSILTPHNIEEIPHMYRFARNNNIFPYFETVLKKGNAVENPNLYLTNEQIKDIFYRLLTIDQEEFNIEWFPAPSFVGFFCAELYYSMLIDNFGYLKPCAGINISLDNYHENSLKNLWSNEWLVNLRNIDKNIKGACKSCEHRLKSCFYGCRGDAFLNTNDVFGNYNECWWGKENV